MRLYHNQRNCALCTHKHNLFKFLSDEELREVNENRIEINYKANETIVKEGTPTTHFISFSHGIIKICMEGKDKNIILQYLRPPDFYLASGIFADHRNHYTLTAVEDTSACLIDINVFLKVLSSNKEFMYEYLKYQCNKELMISDRLMILTQKQMHGRIANALLYLKNEVFTKDNAKITISKSDLANLSSINKDSVGRVLKEFHEGAIIKLEGNTIELLDVNILRQINAHG